MEEMFNMEEIFDKLFNNLALICFNKNFLREKIRYYETIKKDEHRNLVTEKFIYENYDAFEIWCKNNNKEISFPDLEFKVKGWNC